MADRSRPRRGPSRFLAPLALAATIFVVYLIVSGNEQSGSQTTTHSSTATPHHGGSGSGSASGSDGAKQHTSHGQDKTKQGSGHSKHGTSPAGESTGGTSTTAATTTSTTETTTTGTSTSGPGAKFYVVQSGDTMGIISVKTHVPLATIEALNPGVSSNAMSVGQRLRIRK